MGVDDFRTIAILASFVNLLLPPRGFGEGWGGVKNLRLLQELLYLRLNTLIMVQQHKITIAPIALMTAENARKL